MTKTPDDILNLDNENVFLLHTTDIRVRDWIEETDLGDEFAHIFDDAQETVFDGHYDPAYIVIKISKEKQNA